MIDADGYITISRARKMNAGRCEPAVYHALVVGISGTDRRAHEMAMAVVGGSISKYVPLNPRHKPQFQWAVSGPTAVRLIKSIAPHLRVKSAQALVALEFQETLREQVASRRGSVPPYRITDEQRVARDRLCEAMRALNGWRRNKEAH